MEQVNFIQTLSFNKSKDPYKNAFGWTSPEYHLMSWALSCLLLKKNYGKVDLYCNSEAENLLIKELGLPYNKVHLSHNELTLPDEKLWALPKVFTYSLQKKPFLHVDGDVFLFNKLPSKLIEADLISQNIEEATDYYLQTQKQLMENFTYFPTCIENDFRSVNPIKAVNAGILGGKNIDFISEYTDLAFKYINNNIHNLASINVDRFNVFFEQHLFYSLAKDKGNSIEVLINSTIKDNQYLYLGNFHETPCMRSYLHLLGHYKRDEHTCKLMAFKLRELYPEYYYKIISIFKTKNINKFYFYNITKFNSLNSFLQFSKKAVTAFCSITHDISDSETEINTFESGILKTLRYIVNNTIENQLLKEQLLIDFQAFSLTLFDSLKNYRRPTNEYLYGRDLDSTRWYCEVFATGTMATIIERCHEIIVIPSKFDWSGLINKYRRVGVRYYEELELIDGEFYNLVIPEVDEDGFSLHDLDEMENLILSHLESSMAISDLFTIMLQYVENDIIENHLEEYKILFLEMTKQLLLKKAVKPMKNLNHNLA